LSTSDERLPLRDPTGLFRWLGTRDVQVDHPNAVNQAVVFQPADGNRRQPAQRHPTEFPTATTTTVTTTPSAVHPPVVPMTHRVTTHLTIRYPSATW
jgi:hypothetical protein